MIFINPDSINPNDDWRTRAKTLLEDLKELAEADRAKFIEGHRDDTWGADHLLEKLRDVVGNKCWYSEVALEGADPNVDHFRPKGSIREVDENLIDLKEGSAGYWWLAFEYRNYRLCSMHTNQRRVDEKTAGGKWNYFPIRGNRTPDLTEWSLIEEDVLALDPCSATDVSLLWFDSDGKPCVARRGTRDPLPSDEKRVKATIWLYHLDKIELETSRLRYIDEIRTDLLKADAQYKLWNRSSASPNHQAKNNFDSKIAEIKKKIANKAVFAGAKRCAVRQSMANYPWIEEFEIV